AQHEKEESARLKAVREAARAEHRAAATAVRRTEERAVVDAHEPARGGGVNQPSAPPEALAGALVRASLPPAPAPPGLLEPGAPESAPAATEAGGLSDGHLIEALERGDLDAGRELLGRLLQDRARSHDAVVVAQHLVALKPGDAGTLGLLITAASRDKNHALALAVRHVIGSYGAGEIVLAPEAEQLV